MNDPLIAQFAEACGARGPLDLRIGLADGRVMAEGSVAQPFTLVGRDEACDVTLTDPEVHPRHAWIQVIDGRVFALDLGSRAGVVWPDGSPGPGWMDPDTTLKIGPFRVTLRNPVSPRPGRSDASPVQADPDLAVSRPAVQLEFKNGRPPKDKWVVNRVLTLVGKSEACKLNLVADDVSPYHCGLVLTPTGLWVVDLSGRGVVVNGERMRVAPLPDGAALSIGRFSIGCRYPVSTDTPHGLRQPSGRTSPGRVLRAPPPPTPDDEVPLGGLPSMDSSSGLPSSHILHGTFRRPNSSGAMSAPILLAAGPTSDAAAKSGRIGVPVPAPVAAPADHPAAALIGQLAEIHGQMFEQVQQALLMMARLCGEIRAGRSAAVEQELGRIKDLNGELARLQGEVTRLALAEAGSQEMKALDESAVRGAAGSEAIHDWVQERIGKLHRERRERWDKLLGLFAVGD